MAGSDEGSGGLGATAQTSSHDPILEKVAKTNTFDSDWPTLRHHLGVALLATVPLFQSLRTPGSSQSILPEQSPTSPETPPHPDTSIGSSPKSSPLVITSRPPNRSLLLSASGPSSSASGSGGNYDTTPSTLGGLVIPPFPPLDPERRARRLSSASSNSSGPGPGTSPIAPSSPLSNLRMNGHPSGNATAANAIARAQVMDGEWDEDVVIGGKMLPGSMEEDEGKKEVERISKILDDLDSAPFTIQRLAELLLDPTLQHRSLGKFLRAIEKNLLVTSSWEAPSYTAVPPSSFAGSRGLFGPSASSSPAMAATDATAMATMRVGATTPMFSPIPFLPRDSVDTMDMDLDAEGSADELVPAGAGARERMAEGLMSPLVLDDDRSNGVYGQQQLQQQLMSGDRNETPEPEGTGGRGLNGHGHGPGNGIRDAQARANGSNQISSSTNGNITNGADPSSRLSGNESSDPAHQPYLGRVDELDTGPIRANGNGNDHSTTTDTAEDRREAGQEHSRSNPAEGSGSGSEGTGEGGNMTPHGMSERPVPISATTTVTGEEERRIAGIPRNRSVTGLNERFVREGEGGGGT